MKVVHIITRLILGGAQENTLITCRELARRGHDVTLITGPALGPEGELFNQANVKDYKVIVVDKLRRAINPVYDLIAYRQIKRHLKEIAPDIVHTHSAKAGILGRFAAKSLGGFGGASGRGCAVVHTIHGLAFHPYQSALINKFYIAIEKSAAKRTDFFISVADAMTSQALKAGIGRAGRFVTAYSAIEQDGFLRQIPHQQLTEFRAGYGISEDAVVLVCVARLFHLKGHEYIIESAKELAGRFENCVWLFVGDGILKDKLQDDISRLGLAGRFKFTGLLPPKVIPLAIQASDILVHCSLREGLARTLPQAMLCSRCAVSFDVDGAREVVNEKTGRLIEPKNVRQLTEACAELIGDKSLRMELGRSGREFVRHKFTPKAMVDKIEAVYKDLLNETHL